MISFGRRNFLSVAAMAGIATLAPRAHDGWRVGVRGQCVFCGLSTENRGDGLPLARRGDVVVCVHCAALIREIVEGHHGLPYQSSGRVRCSSCRDWTRLSLAGPSVTMCAECAESVPAPKLIEMSARAVAKFRAAA